MNKQELEDQIQSHSPGWWAQALKRLGAKNKYVCEADRQHHLITVDSDPGVTPSGVECGTRFMPEGCHGRMHSRNYRANQNAKPGWEWYRPESNGGLFGKNEAQHEHVLNGGLLLRPLKEEAQPERSYPFGRTRGVAIEMHGANLTVS